MPSETESPTQGTITIRWKQATESAGAESLSWEYAAEPPIPDELARQLLLELAERL